MKVSVIVLTNNSRDQISACLSALTKVAHSAYFYEILVVDNNSNDDTVDVIHHKFPNLRVIVNPANLGFGGGFNVGIQQALQDTGQFVWLLTPAITVAQDTLLALLSGADTYPDAGIFSPKLFHAGESAETLWSAGLSLNWSTFDWEYRGRGQPDGKLFDHDTQTDFIQEDCLFIRSRLFSTVGLLDSRYFGPFTVADYCLRTRNHRWKLMTICQSRAWFDSHNSVSGFGQPEYFYTRNRLLFGFKYAPPRAKLSLAVSAVRNYLSGRPWQRRAVLDYFTGNLGSGPFEL